MIMLPKRPVALHEQPDRAHAGLQQALRVRSLDESTGNFKPLSSAPMRKQHSMKSPLVGVPHGVTNAIVIGRHIHLMYNGGQPEIFFCRSGDYRVLEQTISGADSGRYPHFSNTFISTGCPIPDDEGIYDVRMRVSVNGVVHLHVERFDEHIYDQETAGV